MAEEATTVEPETLDPVAEFQEFLNKQPEDPDYEEEVTAQDPGVEESAETDAGDEPEVVEQPTVEPVVEGPSFLMKQEAERAGVDPKFIAVAESDKQLERMILATKETEKPADAPVIDDSPLSFELPEDEYPADDPVRKALGAVVEGFNKRLQQRDGVIAQLAQIENERFEREQAQTHEAKQREYQALVSPFDEYLDSFDSPELGKAANLSAKQKEARTAVWERYYGLGADPKLDKETLSRKAQLALSDYRPELVEQRTKKTQAVQRQQRSVLGGGHSRPVNPAKTEADLIKELNEAIEGKRPLDL
jgi:hypothetical protein